MARSLISISHYLLVPHNHDTKTLLLYWLVRDKKLDQLRKAILLSATRLWPVAFAINWRLMLRERLGLTNTFVNTGHLLLV